MFRCFGELYTTINIYIKRELFYMVLVFWRLMRNYVERNAVVTLYRDFLSSPINGTGYCWSNSFDSWFGKEWLGSNPTKWWTGDIRVWMYLMRRITENNTKRLSAIRNSQRFSLRMNDIREDMKLKVKVAYALLKALIELSLSSD